MSRHSLSKIFVCLSLAAACSAYAAETNTSPAGADARSQTGRSFQDVVEDFQKAVDSFHEQVVAPGYMLTEAKRAEAAPKAIPILKRGVGYLNELKASDNPKAVAMARGELPFFTSFLAIFGDKETLDQLNKDAAGSDAGKALDAQSSMLMMHWIQSSHDAAKQQKVLEEAQKLARDNPDNNRLTDLLTGMGEMGAASHDLAMKVKLTAVGMNTPIARQMKEKVEHEAKLGSMENKPLVIEGVKLDGSKFSTADWKGKVVFVEFWATFCPICKADLPRVKKAYADFHDKGMELVGISCDDAPQDLVEFLARNKEMTWPQLYDAKQPGWSPIATSFGVESIPTMFLIDKKGVVRSVDAEQDFEKMIPKLLAEQD